MVLVTRLNINRLCPYASRAQRSSCMMYSHRSSQESFVLLFIHAFLIGLHATPSFARLLSFDFPIIHASASNSVIEISSLRLPNLFGMVTLQIHLTLKALPRNTSNTTYILMFSSHQFSGKSTYLPRARKKSATVGHVFNDCCRD